MTPRLTVVIGAVTPPGRLHAAATAVAAAAQASGAEVEVVDLAATRLELADGRPEAEHDAPTRAAVGAVAGAHAIVVASPVYRASLPGALKNLLDLVPVAGLAGKPVGILTMGGSAHHYLGADRHLRDVLAWFGALVAPTSVYLTGGDFADGRPTDPAGEALRELATTVVTLADRLAGVALGPAPLAAKAW